MKTDLKIYNGLYGEDHFPQSNDFIHAEELEFRSKMYNWEINQHVHNNLVQIFILIEGKGKLFSEKNIVQINGPSLIIIPTNTLHGFSFENDIKGNVYTIPENYFEALLKDKPSILYDINRLQYSDYASYSAEFEEIKFVNNLIFKEINEGLLEKRFALNILFQMLLLNFYRRIVLQKVNYWEGANKNLKYILAFQKSIKLNYIKHLPIQFYADELNISVVHLNRVCNNVLQKSPIQVVHEQLILEAKKYLLNTTYSISEIAYFLNFSDPAYFTRFFKKMVGVSPTDFKKI